MRAVSAVLVAVGLVSCAPAPSDVPEPETPEAGPVTLTLLDDVVYYDGYAATVDEPSPPGVLRLANSLNAVRLTDKQLEQLQDTLTITVVVGALCDNYDRLGYVNVAMVPRGRADYAITDEDVVRLEVARFITPFMNMNIEPKSVPYEWELDSVINILKDPEIRAEFDFWFELEIFGVPYAANTEVRGCQNRIDTQSGSLQLYSDRSRNPQPFKTFIPIAVNEAFNDYQPGASDEIGQTRKTISVTVDADSPNAQLVLITSNHGANNGGEEYIRRLHTVLWDGETVYRYAPGRDTCEPFRQYNTQANGIYGSAPRTPEEWQSFSNWCPGDIIDTRIIPLGAVTAGTHEFIISVPAARFVDDQGNFPFSLYMQLQ
jgi:hypothetical protein